MTDQAPEPLNAIRSAQRHMVHGHAFCSQCVKHAADLDDVIAVLRPAERWWTDGAMVNVGEAGDEGFVGDAATSDDAQRIVDAHNEPTTAVRSAFPKESTQPAAIDAIRGDPS